MGRPDMKYCIFHETSYEGEFCPQCEDSFPKQNKEEDHGDSRDHHEGS